MKHITLIILISNILNLIGLYIGTFFINKEVKANFVARYSMILGSFLIIYLMGNLSLFVIYLILNNTIFCILSLIFVILPFIFGALSNYSTANIYINMQMFTILVNSIFLYFTTIT